ncbi:hypothetical protein GCM10009815_11220 [Nocardioides marmoribigeumensis]
MGLLDYLVATSLDGDYAAAAAARGQAGGAGRPGGAGRARARRRHGWTAVVLGLFALLLAVAAVQSARAEPARTQSRASLVSEARSADSALRAARRDVARLRREVARLDRRRVQLVRRAVATDAAATRLGAATGTVPVTGPGMTVTVDDAPDATNRRQQVYDQDLQKLVNGLWAAGAEAVAINGQRLTALSAIRLAGEAITVNFRSLRRPYVVSAIGNPDDLPARFVDTAGGTWWLNLKAVYGLRLDLESADALRLPAVRPPLLRSAEVLTRGGRADGADGAGGARSPDPTPDTPGGPS